MASSTKFLTSVRGRKSDKDTSEFVSIILLCDKSGKRMKSYGPTPLIEVKGKKIIDLQISAIKSVFKSFELIISAGFESEKIVKYVRRELPRSVNVRVVENQMFHHSNCCESVRLCLNNICNDRVLIVSGDLLFHPIALSSVIRSRGSILYQNSDAANNLEVGAIHSEKSLIGLNYGVDNKVWSEISFFRGKETIECLRGIISSVDYKNRLLFEAINSMVDHKKKIDAIYNDGPESIKINNIKTLKRVNNR
tara:strand:+ start:3172 stop:3924 length:753 start_codon:yes stop_codon:yes gene_type:complete